MLSSAGIPVIETWDLPNEPIDQVVGFSNEEAMRLLIATLGAKGYRRFGYVGGKTESDSRGEQRRKGFIRALDELGLLLVGSSPGACRPSRSSMEARLS